MYIVKIGVIGEELTFDEMLGVYQGGSVSLYSECGESYPSLFSEYWKPRQFKGLYRNPEEPFNSSEEARRHYAETLKAPDAISVHFCPPWDWELSRDVTLYACLFEVIKEADPK